MHTFGETGAGVPAFLAKLWRLVEDPETNNLIYWSRDGRSFIIQNQAQFARELLPLNYKHNNMASFIRQLNMYGFHKITSIDNGGLKFDRDEMEFSHPYFKRGCPYLLEHIKRKIANTKTTIDERAGMKPEAVSKVLNEVKVMRGRQDSLDSRFSVMKQENEALWREIASLRQKHMKQQQIVNKLIQFLVTIVQPSRNMSGVKRHFQLMINDAPQSSKLRKRSESETGGPVIHELPEELLDEVADSDAELLVCGSPNVLSPADASNHGGSEIHDEPSPKSVVTSDRPNSTQSISSHYDSNLSEDTVLPPEKKQNINTSAGLNCNSYEPEQVVFHISEVPDQDVDSPSFMDENILNTPMVKQELAKSQDRQLRGRKRKHQEQAMQNPEPIVEHPQSISSGPSRSTEKGSSNTLRIKVENEVDPLMFLDVPENSENSNLLSPNGNSNSSHRDKQLYTSDGFINADMPSDLFEESPMIGDINLASGSYNENLNLEEISREAAEADGGRPAVASTSADASSFDKNQKNSLTLAKYPIDDDIMRQEFTNHLETVQDDLDNLKDILRGDGYSLDSSTLLGNATTPANRIILSSPLDGDILAKLFSDSDILAPYGLSLTGDAAPQNSKKGSEVVSYQPYLTTDFSDLLDMNSPESIGKTPDYSDKSTKGIPCSTLNTPLSTPYPERE